MAVNLRNYFNSAWDTLGSGWTSNENRSPNKSFQEGDSLAGVALEARKQRRGKRQHDNCEVATTQDSNKRAKSVLADLQGKSSNLISHNLNHGVSFGGALMDLQSSVATKGPRKRRSGSRRTDASKKKVLRSANGAVQNYRNGKSVTFASHFAGLGVFVESTNRGKPRRRANQKQNMAHQELQSFRSSTGLGAILDQEEKQNKVRLQKMSDLSLKTQGRRQPLADKVDAIWKEAVLGDSYSLVGSRNNKSVQFSSSVSGLGGFAQSNEPRKSRRLKDQRRNLRQQQLGIGDSGSVKIFGAILDQERKQNIIAMKGSPSNTTLRRKLPHSEVDERKKKTRATVKEEKSSISSSGLAGFALCLESVCKPQRQGQGKRDIAPQHSNGGKARKGLGAVLPVDQDDEANNLRHERVNVFPKDVDDSTAKSGRSLKRTRMSKTSLRLGGRSEHHSKEVGARSGLAAVLPTDQDKGLNIARDEKVTAVAEDVLRKQDADVSATTYRRSGMRTTSTSLLSNLGSGPVHLETERTNDRNELKSAGSSISRDLSTEAGRGRSVDQRSRWSMRKTTLVEPTAEDSLGIATRKVKLLASPRTKTVAEKSPELDESRPRSREPTDNSVPLDRGSSTDGCLSSDNNSLVEYGIHAFAKEGQSTEEEISSRKSCQQEGESKRPGPKRIDVASVERGENEADGDVVECEHQSPREGISPTTQQSYSEEPPHDTCKITHLGVESGGLLQCDMAARVLDDVSFYSGAEHNKQVDSKPDIDSTDERNDNAADHSSGVTKASSLQTVKSQFSKASCRSESPGRSESSTMKVGCRVLSVEYLSPLSNLSDLASKDLRFRKVRIKHVQPQPEAEVRQPEAVRISDATGYRKRRQAPQVTALDRAGKPTGNKESPKERQQQPPIGDKSKGILPGGSGSSEGMRRSRRTRKPPCRYGEYGGGSEGDSSSSQTPGMFAEPREDKNTAGPHYPTRSSRNKRSNARKAAPEATNATTRRRPGLSPSNDIITKEGERGKGETRRPHPLVYKLAESQDQAGTDVETTQRVSTRKTCSLGQNMPTKSSENGSEAADYGKLESQPIQEDDLFESTPMKVMFGGASDTCPAPNRDIPPQGCGDSWTKNEVELLRQAHHKVDPTSALFWDYVAQGVPGKSGSECCEKWFSLAKTPAPKPRKTSKICPEIDGVTEEFDPIEEDDIFDSTPMRGVLSMVASTKLDSSPMESQSRRNVHRVNGVARPQPKRGFKTYLNAMKRDMARASRQRKLKNQKKKKKAESFKTARLISEASGSGGVEVDCRLTPGGTLKLKRYCSDDEDENLEQAESDDDDVDIDYFA